MVRFYDPANDDDLDRVETLLKSRGIEYVLRAASDNGRDKTVIDVAEEDYAAAEALLLSGGRG